MDGRKVKDHRQYPGMARGFPAARAVNVSERDDIVDADFVHIRGDARARLHIVNTGVV